MTADDKNDDYSERMAIRINRPASAETDPFDGSLPTNTPTQKQGPNTFDGKDAKDWSRRNPGA
jgi:hypothetical protein